MATLNPGESLGYNQSLQSNNGKYALLMQADGNLVLYEGVPSVATAIWASQTWTLPPALRPVRAVMQEDGNFVLETITNNPAWESGTSGHNGSRLIMQDDRDLVIYDPEDERVWATHTQVPLPTEPVTAERDWEDLGAGKWIKDKAILYRNGALVVTATTNNYNWVLGMRARLLIVCVDDSGRAIWVSNELACTTRCTWADLSCASFGTDTFYETYPEVVGRYTNRLDIHQGEEASFADLRQVTIDAMLALKDIAGVAGDLIDAIEDAFG